MIILSSLYADHIPFNTILKCPIIDDEYITAAWLAQSKSKIQR